MLVNLAALDYKYIAKLVSRAQTGDSDAFAELYAATYQRQYHFAYRYLKDEYMAKDALQETYSLALKNLSNLNDPSLIIAWLNQICFRVCYNLHNKQKKYAMELADNDAVLESQHAGLQSSPEDEIVEIDSRQYIMNQVLKLPFTESQVIILKYYKNMKIDEIAKLMDISRSSVKRYLDNGRKRLAKILAT